MFGIIRKHLKESATTELRASGNEYVVSYRVAFVCSLKGDVSEKTLGSKGMFVISCLFT